MYSLSTTINKMQTNKEKGFTLIELMIVVAILGILAAIAIPNFMRFQAKSRQSEVKTNLGAIGTTAEAFRAENDTYVATWNQLGWAPQGANIRYDYGYNTALLDVAAGAHNPETEAVAATATTFLAVGEGDIDAEAVGEDCWTYNQLRALTNTNNDVSVDTAC